MEATEDGLDDAAVEADTGRELGAKLDCNAEEVVDSEQQVDADEKSDAVDWRCTAVTWTSIGEDLRSMVGALYAVCCMLGGGGISCCLTVRLLFVKGWAAQR